jgi:hypothetical protein
VIEMEMQDRHVLAVAFSAEADILLTDNTVHFARQWMVEHGMALLGSAGLLTRLAETFPDKLPTAHQQALRLSRKSEVEILATLESIVGEPVTDTIRAGSESRAWSLPNLLVM